jgi:hypothetical protein
VGEKAKALITVMDPVLMEAESAGGRIANAAIRLLLGSSSVLSYIVKNW